MSKFILAAVAAAAMSVGIGGTAQAGGYKQITTRTVASATLVKAQSVQAVAISNGYGHAAVAVKKTTVTAVNVNVKKTTVIRTGY